MAPGGRHWRCRLKMRRFDLVCCQFGAMFFPDRAAGLSRSKASPEARRTFSVQRMGSHRGECICRRCDECSRQDFSERSAALSGAHAARLPRYGADPSRAGGRRLLQSGDRDEGRTKPRIVAAHPGRRLLSGNASSHRNRGQRRESWTLQPTTPRPRLRTGMAAARLRPKFRPTSSWPWSRCWNIPFRPFAYCALRATGSVIDSGSSPPSWPGLSRPTTHLILQHKTWMPATSAGMTVDVGCLDG